MSIATKERPETNDVAASLEAWHEISQLLYREVRYIKDERLRDWIADFIHPDILFQVAERQLRMRRDRYTGPEVIYSWNDRLPDIEMRVRALESGLQWSANPREISRHNISNIEVYEAGRPGEYRVLANVLLIRNRRVYEELTHSYAREDLWVRQPDGRLLLKHRLCMVDQRYIRGKNLAFFM